MLKVGLLIIKMVNQNMNGGNNLTKANKVIATMIGFAAIIVISIVIISFIKHQEVNYINSHIETIDVTFGTSDQMMKINSGEYQYVDYKPNGKELEIKKIDSDETYNIDLSDKHIELTGNEEVDNGSVFIDAPSQKVKFNLFESYKDESKTKILMNKSQMKEVNN